MERSILRIDTADDNHALFMCGNRKCSAGIFNIVYSGYHASLLGWRRMELPEDETEAYGAKFLPLCPECAKNTEQANQPDKEIQ